MNKLKAIGNSEISMTHPPSFTINTWQNRKYPQKHACHFKNSITNDPNPYDIDVTFLSIQISFNKNTCMIKN